MKQIKTFLLVITIPFILLFIRCNGSKEVSLQPLSVKIELIKEYTVKDSISDCCRKTIKYIDNKNYEILITLENNTDSIISPVLMTCSWDQNIIINTLDVDYLREDCNSNYPRPIHIQPHNKVTLTAILAKNIYSGECQTCPEYDEPINFRMGLIFISEFKKYESIMEDKSLWTIIWSNRIKLSKRTHS